jgi:hypothetical protein
MFRRLTNFALLLIWLLAGCDSGGFASRGPITLAFTVQPASAVAGAAISLVVVTVQDAHGNTLSSASTSITMVIGSRPVSGTLAGQTTVAAVQGVATFSNLIIDKAGSGYTLTAVANGATGATSSSFDVTPAPRKLAFGVQPKPSQVGHAISPAVEVAVQDQQGETLAGASATVTIVIASGPAGGRLSGAVTVPAVNGVATFADLTIDTPGYGYTLLAYAEGLTVFSDPFTIWVPFVISGAVTGATADGVLITLSGAMSGATTTAGGGLYSFFGLPNGNYTLTPSKVGYSFSPASFAVTVNGGNVTGQNFTANFVSCPALTSVPSGTTGILLGVWGSGPNDVWAVGGSTILHWNGSSWSSVASPPNGGLVGVWGSGPNDVWAVGGSGTILHWNGSSWSSFSSGTTSDLLKVWGSGPNDVWAVGGAGLISTILHWNGTAWTPVDFDTGSPLWGVWGSGPADVWAVDDGGNILHWNGTSWAGVGRPEGDHLYGVWGSGPNDVWAVGWGGTILHWNGSAWSSVASPPANGFSGVWGSGPNDVWAVGGLLVHWDGTAWASVCSGTTNYLRAIWGSGPNDVWAVGEGGTILKWGP